MSCSTICEYGRYSVTAGCSSRLPCRTSAATPTISRQTFSTGPAAVQHDIGERSARLTRFPSGSSLGKYLRARLWLMMTTGVDAPESFSENARPFSSGIPIVRK